MRKAGCSFGTRENLGLLERFDHFSLIDQREAEIDPGLEMQRVDLQRFHKVVLGLVIFRKLREREGQTGLRVGIGWI